MPSSLRPGLRSFGEPTVVLGATRTRDEHRRDRHDGSGHAAVISPNPAVINIPRAHARYITVIGRRPSEPRCAARMPTSADPSPPAANTRARSTPLPSRSWLITYGIRVSHGPHTQNRLTVAVKSATQIHVSLRT